MPVKPYLPGSLWRPSCDSDQRLHARWNADASHLHNSTPGRHNPSSHFQRGHA